MREQEFVDAGEMKQKVGYSNPAKLMNYHKMKKATKEGPNSVRNYMSHIEAFARTNQQLNPSEMVSNSSSRAARLTNEPDMASLKSFNSGKENLNRQLGRSLRGGGVPPRIVCNQKNTIVSGKTETLEAKFGKSKIDTEDTVSVKTENTQITAHRHAMRDFSSYYNTFRKRSNSFCK